MSKKISPLDRAAEELTARADTISKGRLGSDSFCEVSHCLDTEVIGAFPQATPPTPGGDFIDDGYLYFDRFPEPAGDPIKLHLKHGAILTDVLSSTTHLLCFLVSPRALEVFNRFNLGNVRFYEAVVTGNENDKLRYTYIFLCNHITSNDIDFARSECFLVDMISQPIGEIAVANNNDYLDKREKARAGSLPDSEPFCRIAIGKVQLLPGHKPQADIFGISDIDTRIYASTALRDALLEAEITGLEFGENSRLFL